MDLTVACMTGLNVAVYKKQNCPLHLFQGHVIINVPTSIPYNGSLERKFMLNIGVALKVGIVSDLFEIIYI